MQVLEKIAKLSENLTSLSIINEEEILKHIKICMEDCEKITDLSPGKTFF